MRGFMVALLTSSVTMSALALVYMAITPLLAKRYSVKGRYYTWLVVAMGLIIPYRPQWGNVILRVGVPVGAAAPFDQIVHAIGGGWIGNTPPAMLPLPAEGAALPPVLPGIPWWQAAAMVWFAGMAAFLAYYVIKHCRFAKMAGRWSEKVTDEQPLALLRSLKAEMGISRPVSLYQCSSIGSPMMIGIFSPRILLPDAGLAQDELRFVLRHELIHYARKDLIYKCLVLAAAAIHWFNPIVYLMAREIEIQCELSCDAETVRRSDAGVRQQYSETIIGMVKYRARLKTAISTNFCGGNRGMKKRILSIMDMGRKRTGIAIFCVMLMVTMGTGFASCSENDNPANSPGSEETAALSGPSVTVGAIIPFGGADWRVLEIREGKALVVSEKLLLKGAYHSENVAVTWGECDMRQYLNGPFYDCVFSAEEKARIVDAKVENNDNPWYGTAGGNDTIDKVFLLSLEEVLRYYGNSGELENREGGESIKNVGRIAVTQEGKAAWWWLRTPGIFYYGCGTNHSCFVCVTSTGSLSVYGEYVYSEFGGIRPALWLQL